MSYRGGGIRRDGRNTGRKGRSGGRGEYYRNKYGRGGRGGDGRGRGNPESDRGGHAPSGGGSFDDLQNKIRRLNGKPYGGYHDLDTDANHGWVNPKHGFPFSVKELRVIPLLLLRAAG